MIELAVIAELLSLTKDQIVSILTEIEKINARLDNLEKTEC